MTDASYGFIGMYDVIHEYFDSLYTRNIELAGRPINIDIRTQ